MHEHCAVVEIPRQATSSLDIQVGYRVGRIKARDDDAMEPNNQIVYILKRGGRGKFSINHLTGAHSRQPVQFTEELELPVRTQQL